MLCVNNVLKNKCFACESERYGTNQNINIMYWFKIMTNIIVGLYIYLFISLISTVFFLLVFFFVFLNTYVEEEGKQTQTHIQTQK